MALTTDATPRISPTPVQILQDEHRMKRLKASLSDGIFDYATEARATRIAEECLKICGGSSDTLSHIVQSNSFTGHTPLYWIIINHRQQGVRVPPLLTQLLSACGRLDLDAQKDIALAFHTEYSSDLYGAIKNYLPNVPGHQAYNESVLFQGEEERPRLSVASFRKSKGSSRGVERATVKFRIPFFFKRLFTEQEVSFEFPVTGRLWKLKARLREESDLPSGSTSHAEWAFELSELQSGTAGGSGSWRIKMEVVDPDERAPAIVLCDNTLSLSKLAVSAEPLVLPAAANSDLLTLRCNPYTSGTHKQLVGKIYLDMS